MSGHHPGSAEYRVEEVEFLAESGESPEQWAQRLDTTNQALAKLLRRAGRHDLAGPLYAVIGREERQRQAARLELATPKPCPCCGLPLAPTPERLAQLLRIGGVT